jgi:soluble lytic murein transglycosylase
LGSDDRLPTIWPATAIGFLDAQRVPLTREEVRRVVRVVDRAARRHGIDPLMVLAVIHVESRFDPWAVSPKGALGLMQLLPSTAREIAPRVGIRWTSDDLLFDPEINVALGAYYLKQMLQRFDGNLDAALAAYERGPGRLQMRLAKSVDDVPLGYSNRVWAAILELQARVLA